MFCILEQDKQELQDLYSLQLIRKDSKIQSGAEHACAASSSIHLHWNLVKKKQQKTQQK